MSSLREEYEARWSGVLVPLADRLKAFLKEQLEGIPRIDQISTRAKGVDRFVTKAEKYFDGQAKYDDPINQIQDQIGARIITFYLSDVDRIAGEVKEYFKHIEEREVEPESDREFDYAGRHFVAFLPNDILQDDIDPSTAPTFFELQIKTLFQHAWAEANHDLGYKPNSDLTKHERRQIAFTSAQAWGADLIFDRLHTSLG